MLCKNQVALLLLLTILTAGCAPPRRYAAKPILPAQSASRLEARGLADPGLQAYMEANVGHALTPWPPPGWDLRMLSLAALYLNPAMESARARLAEAEAAETTAGARPNPTLSFAPGVPSPYLFSSEFAVPLETAGKRGHRVESARALTVAAEFDAADSAWRVRSAVRSALLKSILASRTLQALHTEETLRADQVGMLEKRLAVGLIPRPEVDQARIELEKLKLASATAAGQLAEGRAALASALALPASALEGVDLKWAELDSPPPTESLTPAAIQRNAVLNRLDVRRALAQYAAAESNLQLEIARQYPDVQIGPGYTYEEGHSFFTVGLTMTLPVFNRNQGPIAEAEARRRQAGAAFVERQSQVISESQRSLARYTSALRELAEADGSLRTLEEQQVRRTERAVQAGEEDRLALAGVRIEQAVVARGRLDALARAQTALGELEDAVQRPLDPGDAFAPEIPAPRATDKSPRERRR